MPTASFLYLYRRRCGRAARMPQTRSASGYTLYLLTAGHTITANSNTLHTGRCGEAGAAGAQNNQRKNPNGLNAWFASGVAISDLTCGDVVVLLGGTHIGRYGVSLSIDALYSRARDRPVRRERRRTSVASGHPRACQGETKRVDCFQARRFPTNVMLSEHVRVVSRL